MQSPDPQTLEAIRVLVQTHFWEHGDFWIETPVGLVGLLFSFLAFKQATRAAEAATKAAKAVKLQSMSVDLAEVSQKLRGLQRNTTFDEAKEIHNDVSFKLQRVMAPFEKDTDLHEQIDAVNIALDAAHEALVNVLPTDPGNPDTAPQSVYNAVEDKFSTLNGHIGRLLGLVELRTVGERK